MHKAASCRPSWPARPAPQSSTRLLVLTEASTTVEFVNIDAEPVPSLLRGFSAPVVLDVEQPDAHWLTLLAHDTDPFNRWEAGQRLALATGAGRSPRRRPGAAPSRWMPRSSTPCAACLRHPALDAAFKELALTLPSETYIAEQLDEVDPQRVHAVREAMREQLAQALHADWADRLRGQSRQRRLPSRSAQHRPPRAGRHGAHHALPGGPRERRHGLAGQGAAALQGRQQHDRPLQRPLGPGDQRPATGARRADALPRHVPARSAGDRQVVCAAGRCARPRRPRSCPPCASSWPTPTSTSRTRTAPAA